MEDVASRLDDRFQLLTTRGVAALPRHKSLRAVMAAWFDTRNVKYRLSGGISIGDLVKFYFDEGKAEHVRPELAFAQAHSGIAGLSLVPGTEPFSPVL